MTYQRKKFNNVTFNVVVRDSVDGNLPLASFKYYKAAVRYIEKHKDYQLLTIKSVQNQPKEEAPAAGQ